MGAAATMAVFASDSRLKVRTDFTRFSVAGETFVFKAGSEHTSECHFVIRRLIAGKAGREFEAIERDVMKVAGFDQRGARKRQAFDFRDRKKEAYAVAGTANDVRYREGLQWMAGKLSRKGEGLRRSLQGI